MKACKRILGSVFSLWILSAATSPGAAGGVWAWGAGETNTAVDPNYGQSIIPSSPILSGETIALSAGSRHTLALKRTSVALSSEGTVVAWGRNAENQTTVPAAALSGVTAIAAGGLHSLALKSDGTVLAWGAGTTNSGDPNFGQSIVPAGLTTYTNVAAKIVARSVDTVTNKVTLTTLDASLLAPGMLVSGTGIGDGAFIVAIDTATTPKTLYLSATNTVFTAVTTTLTISSGVKAIAAGYYHSLALKSDGTVVAWGRTTDGQTTVPNSCTAIYGPAIFPPNPTPPGTIKAATLVTANANIVAGMRVFGPQPSTLVNGTVGVGAKVVSNPSPYTALTFDTNNSNVGAIASPGTPLAFFPAKQVTAIAAGYAHSVALMNDGTVVAWGSNVEGQTATSLWTGVQAIAAGYDFTVGLNGSGSVLAVGNDDDDQISGAAAAPSGNKAIAAGGYHAAVLKSNDTVYAWGRITQDGTNYITESVPDALSGATAFPVDDSKVPPLAAAVTGITVGGSHTGVIAVGPPIIITQPTAPAITVGGDTTLSVTAMNATGYQWYENGVPMSGKTSDTLILSNVQSVKSYFVKVSNAAGTTTSISVLATMLTRPVVTSEPLDVRVRLALDPVTSLPIVCRVQPTPTLGVEEVKYDKPIEPVTFYAQMSGGELSYQWLKNGVAIVDGTCAWGTTVEGATTSVLKLSDITTTADAGTYTLTATNTLGSVTGKSAILRVDPMGIITLPQITSNLYPLSLHVGTPMTYSITSNTITASTPAADKPSYAATGLPKGLKLNTKTGVISGKPTKVGTYLVTLQAKKKATGTATATLRMVVGVPAV